MSIWYSLHGSVEVRPSPEVERIVAEFNALTHEISADLEDHGDGTATVEFGGGDFCSYATAGEIDDKAKELGPHVVSFTSLIYDCDGERGELPIGPPADVPKGDADPVESPGQSPTTRRPRWGCGGTNAHLRWGTD